MSDTYTLVVLSHAPYAGSAARASLDLALAFAVFGQAPKILFQGMGTWQLRDDQTPAGRKSLRKVIDSMPLYDVETVYVCDSDLQNAGLDPSTLPAHAQCVDDDAAQKLRAGARHIVSL